jgi:hypothetical protein
MLRKLVILFSLAIALVMVVAAHAAFQQPRPGQQPPPPPTVEEPPPAMAVPPSYRYDSRGRRDPFVNPVPKPKVEATVPIVRPKGLPGVMISEAVISGIVWSREVEMNRAVIAAPGGRTYFARRGDALFDAVIKDIERDGVVFQVKAKDRDGNPIFEEVVRRVRATP